MVGVMGTKSAILFAPGSPLEELQRVVTRLASPEGRKFLPTGGPLRNVRLRRGLRVKRQRA